ncbi:HAD family phosphatase [Flavobacterium antarcticum]|uniref:HAD family hydrolase n=1 Tax=Flavobacterium antarcticum TaxID=271155 RepID=UPI0003B2F12A|nr:HAD-IA family hydrolase [Flavobacterium antarcticum]
MIKTVIFDMDGVLVNSEPLHHQVCKIQFRNLKIDVSDELFATFTGSSNKMIYKKLKNHFNLDSNVTELIAEKNRLFIKAFDEDSTHALIAGVKDLIIELHENGMQLIVASSSEMEIIDAIFERFELNKYFSHKVSGADFPESKPNPAIFLKAVELSNHSKSECIIIEDSTNGIKAANSAEIYCIAYKAAEVNSQNQSLADEIIYSYKELNYDTIRQIYSKINPNNSQN